MQRGEGVGDMVVSTKPEAHISDGQKGANFYHHLTWSYGQVSTSVSVY